MNSEITQAIVHILETAWIPIAEVVAAIIIGPRVKKLIIRMAAKSNDKGVMTFLGSAANLLIIAIGFILAAEALGVKMTSVVALISALGLGVSLALKSNMANVAGGLQILLTKPFKIGDYIAVASHKGYVRSIELMFTTLQSDNDKEIVVPNSTIVSDTITNYSRYPALRLKAKFSIAYGNNFPQIKEQTEQILTKNQYIKHDKPILVTVESALSGYVMLQAICYTSVDCYENCKRQILEDIVFNLPAFEPSAAVVQQAEIVPDPEIKAAEADSSSQETDTSKA